jgi:excisionase family DNA binding protein
MTMQSQKNTNGDEVDLLNRTQAAQRLNMSLRNLALLVAEGKLPYIKIGKLLRFIPRDLDDFIQSHRIAKSKTTRAAVVLTN